jgi:hypothetical protein
MIPWILILFILGFESRVLGGSSYDPVDILSMFLNPSVILYTWLVMLRVYVRGFL